MSKSLVSSLLLAGALLLLVIAALQTDRPPAPLPAETPAEGFSAIRARQTLWAITRAPHPVGSAEHARVREHLVQSLAAVGLEPQVQHTTAVSPFRSDLAADIHNVLARMPGTDSSGAILLLAHYDSVIGSHGASDDAAGVAAVLESLRALRNRPPLRNDVIVLLSDAEEIGLLGAAAFVADHPWFEDVELVINVEARGSYGAAFMFQTTGANGPLIEALADATPYPVANTVMQEVYERLPNGTDLSVFMGTGVAGFDIAYIRGLAHYHTPLDDFQNQSPASLQHHGSYLLGLTAAFGDVDLGTLAAPAQTYFNFGPFAFVHYPASWTLPLALAVAALVNGLLAYGLVRGHVRVIPVLLGLAAAALAIGAAALLGHLGWGWLAARSASVRWDSYRLFYDSAPWMLVFCSTALAVSTTVIWLFQRWATAAELVAAPLVVWSLIGIAGALYVPGAGYLLVWPALATALAAIGWVLRNPWPEAEPRHDVPTTALLALLAAPPILLLVPLVVLLEVAMTLRIVAVCAGLLAFVAALSSLQMATVVRGLGTAVPAAFLGLAMASAAWALLVPEHDAVRKRPNHIAYAADVSGGTAYWISSDPEIDEWTVQFLGAQAERAPLPELGFGGRPLWQAPAPAATLAATAVTMTAEVIDGDSRHLELHVQPPAGTYRTTIDSMPGNPPLAAVQLNDRWPLEPDTPADEPERIVTFMGAPAAGFTLRLTAPAATPVVLRVRTTRPGLPIAPEYERPEDTMSRGDTTVVQQTVRLAPPAAG